MPSLRYDYSRFASAPPPFPLFHYTTMKGLLGIIQSGTIYASHIQYLNDSVEFTHAIERIQQELDSLYAAAAEFAGNAALAACIAEFKGPRRSRLPAVYVTSFSEKGDLLSQWRAYASRGGVSIGFSAAKLAERAAPQEFWLAKCRYTESEQRDLITKFVREVLSAPSSDSYSPAPGATLHGYLLTVAPAMKHRSFKEEAEWRLISHAASATDSIRFVDFRTDGSIVIPYCPVRVNYEKGTPVDVAEAIVVGPTPHPELSKQSIESLVYKRNLRPRPRVTNSEIPYRNW
jgi:hypothetical protein